MLMAQVIANVCPDWLPSWLCTATIRGVTVLDMFPYVFMASVVALIWYDLTHPVGGEQ